jgi:hypothetical protein
MTAAAVARIPPANPGPLPHGLDALVFEGNSSCRTLPNAALMACFVRSAGGAQTARRSGEMSCE